MNDFHPTQEDLIKRRVCSEAEADEIVNGRFLPQVSEQQAIFEKKLEALDVSCNAQNVYFRCAETPAFPQQQEAGVHANLAPGTQAPSFQESRVFIHFCDKAFQR